VVRPPSHLNHLTPDRKPAREWAGLITAGGLLLLGHLLMLPAMLSAMLHRRAEYTGHTVHHSGHRPTASLSPADDSGSGGVRPR